MARYTITFLPSGRSASVPAGTTILEAAAASDLSLHSPCGGQGRCGKCAVQVTSGADEVKPPERRVFSEEELAEGWRLACQARVAGAAEAFVPDSSLMVEHHIAVDGIEREIVVEPNVRKVALRLAPPDVDDPRADLNRVMDALGRDVRAPRPLHLLQELPGVLRGSGYQVTAVIAGGALAGLEAGDTSAEAYGAAIDIGTTTVVTYLCHLPTGEVAAVASELNPQSQYGEDVISRLQMAVSEPDGAARLRAAVVEIVNELIARAAREAGVPVSSVYEIAVVGNTCMTHLLLGVPPTGLAAVPFVPVFRGAQTVPAAALGIEVNPEAPVFVAPNIGSFVGADTVGVILASEIDRAEGLVVAVDIGTNGEIVVARNGELRACSTAAGPAFEGARISCGMRAAAGAIDEVSIGDDVGYHVLGEVAPQGLCGSGLVDAVAELVRVGVVTETGRLLKAEEAASAPEKVRRRLVQNEDGIQFVLASAQESSSGRPIALTARDIRQAQLAKGAIAAGIALMLAEVGAEPEDIDRLLLAGAFGNYIRRESAVGIGLIPALAGDRIESVGNAAGVGARLVLLSVAERRRAEEIARRVEHVELSEREGFYDRFVDAMMLRPLPAGS
ncbi:MAG: ASKHA domain-containing protein [Armatimonadota bacterium]|nr:ASKHA domain-containing protein [Armatimonadota bacterium]